MKIFYKYFLSGFLFLIPLIIIYQLISLVSSVVTIFVDINIFIAFTLSFFIISGFGFLVVQVLKKYFTQHLLTSSRTDTLWGTACSLFLRIDDITIKSKQAFQNPVLYKVDDGIYKLGFITDGDMDIIDNPYTKDTTESNTQTEASPASDAVWIFAPYPINFTGELILVEKRKIKKIDQQASESIPLFILSGGLIEHRR